MASPASRLVLDQSELIGALRRVDLFRGLSDEQLKVLIAAFAESVYPQGRWIFRQGDVGESFYSARPRAARVPRAPRAARGPRAAPAVLRALLTRARVRSAVAVRRAQSSRMARRR